MSRSGRGHVTGSLAFYAEGFREDLMDRGYTWGSAARQVHLMAHLSRLLDSCALEPSDLTPEGHLPPRPPDMRPLGCHRLRISNRDCFDGILARLVTGCSWDVAARL